MKTENIILIVLIILVGLGIKAIIEIEKQTDSNNSYCQRDLRGLQINSAIENCITRECFNYNINERKLGFVYCLDLEEVQEHGMG